MTAPNTCAYCRKPGKMTKEHLYPQFLYAYTGPRVLGYNEAADKVTVGERVIRDVCSTCNNARLGALDGYGQKYFQLNNLDKPLTDEQTANIQFDYDLLLRWILKISYNSFRTVDFADDPFASLVPYILTGKSRPKPKFVRLLIEIIRSHKLTEEERPRVQEKFQKTGYIPAYILRSGRVVNFTPEIPCHCRHFQLNAHLFTVFLFPYDTKANEADQATRMFREQYPFAARLEPARNKMQLRVSPRDILDVQYGPDVHRWERFREQQYAAKRRDQHTNAI